MVKQAWENYKKPTPPKWRKRGDFALLILVALQPLILSSPFDDTIKWVLDVIFTTVIVSYKFWTNTQKDE